MLRTYLIPLLAIAGVSFAIVTVVKGSRPQAAQPPVIEPPQAPFDSFVAGSGLVETSSQNIAIGSPIGAVVARVGVKVGQDVRAGEALFELDSRELRAALGEREAAVEVSERALSRLRSGTRPEMLPAARAKVLEAQTSLADQEDRLRRWEKISDPRARSEDEIARQRFAVQSAQARLAVVNSDLALLEAGSWSHDIEVAESQVRQARAAAETTRTEIERRTIRAPIDGRVLQVNVRPGEFAPAGIVQIPLIMMGSVTPLHVRVDVDENDAWRVRAGSKATAYARGNKDISTPLEFVRFEPYVIPKRSLTGESTERVDTRVLQVIFSFDGSGLPLFVGQQVDVFIEAPPIRRAEPTSSSAVQRDRQ
ncbi:Multidrug resistance protein MdtN [Phycisphaerales bacterium]|nr:Multidrug resistance protein MdtN [Phycisphaerales bacterium]